MRHISGLSPPAPVKLSAAVMFVYVFTGLQPMRKHYISTPRLSHSTSARTQHFLAHKRSWPVDDEHVWEDGGSVSLSGSVLSFRCSSLNTKTFSVLNSTQSVIMWLILRLSAGFHHILKTENPLGFPLYPGPADLWCIDYSDLSAEEFVDCCQPLHNRFLIIF